MQKNIVSMPQGTQKSYLRKQGYTVERTGEMNVAGRKMGSENRITAIVLAAGESKRMGAENKLLLPVKGASMVQRVVENVVHASPYIEECIVVLGHEAAAVKDTLSVYPVKWVVNPAYQKGMGSSISAGVRASNPLVTGYMICLSDMPFITKSEYRELVDAFLDFRLKDANAMLVPVYKEQRGNPVVLSSIYKPAMLENTGVSGCRQIVKDNAAHVQLHQMASDHVLRDIDTPAAFIELSG